MHTGNEEHAFVADHPTAEALVPTQTYELHMSMAMQVQTCLMKGLTNNVEALNTVRQQ